MPSARHPNAWLAAQRARFKVGQRALVPGDGEGRNGVWLAELGLNVTTVDASRIGVHKANLLAAERGVTIDAQVADLTTWDWPVEQFDVIAAIYLHFPSNLRAEMHFRMLQALEARRRADPRGLFAAPVGLSRRRQRRRTIRPDMLFEPEDIAEDFDTAEIEYLDEARVTLAEGKRHRGASSVVRLIAPRPTRGRGRRRAGGRGHVSEAIDLQLAGMAVPSAFEAIEARIDAIGGGADHFGACRRG